MLLLETVGEMGDSRGSKTGNEGGKASFVPRLLCGGGRMIACYLGENKPCERVVVFLHGDQVGRGAGVCGGEGLEEEEGRWGERGPAWQVVDVPAPRIVVCTSVTCVENIAAVVAGYRLLRVGANGKARCGTEQSWAQLLLFMLCRRKQTYRVTVACRKSGGGWCPGGGWWGLEAVQSLPAEPACSPLSMVRPWCLTMGLITLATCWLSSSSAVQPSSLLDDLWRPWQNLDALFSSFLSQTIVKFLKRGWACTCMQVCLEREATEPETSRWR